MRYLIDTNIFVFFVADPDRLSRDVRMLLEDYDSQLYNKYRVGKRTCRGL